MPIDLTSGELVGMAAGLIIRWDDCNLHGSRLDFTNGDMFTNHDLSRGRTLYGVEIKVSHSIQKREIGSALYVVRRRLSKISICLAFAQALAYAAITAMPTK